MQQRRGEEEIVVARGCQVQGYGDVEGQCEDWEVPLAEDGAQGTGKDGADGENTRSARQLLLALALGRMAADKPTFSREKQLAGCLSLGLFLEQSTDIGEGLHSTSEGWF